MNRALLFGIAIFFAVVGIALIGGDSKSALAGHCGGGCACSGCNGDCGGCNGCDCGGNKCCGRRHQRRARRCCGCHANDCCGNVCPPACCGCAGGAAPATDAATPPPAPSASLDRAGFSARKVSFRR